MMSISETYLDSHFPDNDSRLNVPGYNLVRTYNPNNTKRNSVCVNFVRSLISPFLKECLLLALFIQNKKRLRGFIKQITKSDTVSV